jgi:hypothetical protein
MISRYRRLYVHDQRLVHDAKTPQLDHSHVTQRLPQVQAATPVASLSRNALGSATSGHIRAIADNAEVIDTVLHVRGPSGTARLAQQVCLPLGIMDRTIYPFSRVSHLARIMVKHFFCNIFILSVL